MLTTAAVLAADLEPGLVAQILDASAESVSGVLDRAARAGVLRASSALPQGYIFAHALIREALYGELSPRGRAEAHRAVAAVLEQEPWRARTAHAELAYHYLRAMPAGTSAGEGSGIARRSAEYADLAGRDALGALAYEEAAAHFGRALEALGRVAEVPPASRCELLLGLAEALMNSGATQRAEPHLREALRLARQSGAARQLAEAALLSAAHLDFNAPDESAAALLREAADAVGTEAPAHRRLGARPLLARTLHEYAQLLSARAAGSDLARAAEALAEARAIASECGMTKLAAILNEQQAATAGPVMLEREGGYWAMRHAGTVARLPDSLGLRYLDLLIRNPGRELAVLDIIQLASPAPAGTTSARPGPPGPAQHSVTATAADDILDARALAEFRRRLAQLDDDLAEAEQWNDTERASRARAERDFLLRELASATGIHGRPRRLGSQSERARVNVTRAIRSAIDRIRTHTPDAAAHLDHAVSTGTYCSYTAQR